MDKSIGKYFSSMLFIFGYFSFVSSKLIVDNLTSGHHYSNAVFQLHYLKKCRSCVQFIAKCKRIFDNYFDCCDDNAIFICSSSYKKYPLYFRFILLRYFVLE